MSSFYGYTHIITISPAGSNSDDNARGQLPKVPKGRGKKGALTNEQTEKFVIALAKESDKVFAKHKIPKIVNNLASPDLTENSCNAWRIDTTSGLKWNAEPARLAEERLKLAALLDTLERNTNWYFSKSSDNEIDRLTKAMLAAFQANMLCNWSLDESTRDSEGQIGFDSVFIENTTGRRFNIGDAITNRSLYNNRTMRTTATMFQSNFGIDPMVAAGLFSPSVGKDIYDMFKNSARNHFEASTRITDWQKQFEVTADKFAETIFTRSDREGKSIEECQENCNAIPIPGHQWISQLIGKGEVETKTSFVYNTGNGNDTCLPMLQKCLNGTDLGIGAMEYSEGVHPSLQLTSEFDGKCFLEYPANRRSLALWAMPGSDYAINDFQRLYAYFEWLFAEYPYFKAAIYQIFDADRVIEINDFIGAIIAQIQLRGMNLKQQWNDAIDAGVSVKDAGEFVAKTDMGFYVILAGHDNFGRRITELEYALNPNLGDRVISCGPQGMVTRGNFSGFCDVKYYKEILNTKCEEIRNDLFNSKLYEIINLAVQMEEDSGYFVETDRNWLVNDAQQQEATILSTNLGTGGARTANQINATMQFSAFQAQLARDDDSDDSVDSDSDDSDSSVGSEYESDSDSISSDESDDNTSGQNGLKSVSLSIFDKSEASGEKPDFKSSSVGRQLWRVEDWFKAHFGKDFRSNDEANALWSAASRQTKKEFNELLDTYNRDHSTNIQGFNVI